VILTTQLRFKKQRVNRPLLLDLDRLRNDHFQQQYQLEVANKFEALERVSKTHTPDELWQQLKETTPNAAKETLRRDFTKRKNWIADDTFELTKKSVRQKQSLQINTENFEVKCRRCYGGKQTELESLCSELKENAQKGNSRPVFQTLKKLTKPCQPCSVAIKDITGKKLTNPEKVKKPKTEKIL